MTVRLITGPPGAGKNTYVEKHKKDGDLVVDFDVLREAFPQYTLEQLKSMRTVAEGVAKTYAGDAWVIRCVADPEKRTALAKELGAEVVVIETPKELAKERVVSRGRNPEKNDEVHTAIDDWWSQYGVVESDLIVRPDTGLPLSDRKKSMSGTQPNENELVSGTESDKGFPAETKIVDMKPEEQAAYWKFQSRKHEGNANNLRTELEKAKPAPKPAEPAKPAEPGAPIDKDALRKELLADIKREQAPELVRSQFEALIGDRLDEKTRDSLLEDLNLANFVKEDGSIDKDRIKTKAELLAPAEPAGPARRLRSHQGPRPAGTKTSVQSGVDLFAEFSKKK